MNYFLGPVLFPLIAMFVKVKALLQPAMYSHKINSTEGNLDICAKEKDTRRHVNLFFACLKKLIHKNLQNLIKKKCQMFRELGLDLIPWFLFYKWSCALNAN